MRVSYKSIGRNIRQARKRIGLTQENLADKLNMSPLHFGRLERGERRVSIDQLAQISDELNVSVEFLLFGAITPEYPMQQYNGLGTIINQLAAGCSENAQGLMLDLCQAIAIHDKFPSP